MHTCDRTQIDGHDAYTLGSPDDISFTVVPAAGMLGTNLRLGGAEFLAMPATVADYATGGPLTGLPLAFPFVNRVTPGTHTLDDREVQIDLDIPGGRRLGNLPAHGVQLTSDGWAVEHWVDEHEAFVGAATIPDTAPWFPYDAMLHVRARLRGSTVIVETSLDNHDSVPVPVAWGWHPWLTLPGVPRQEWAVSLPVTGRVPLGGDMLPTGLAERLGRAERRELRGLELRDGVFDGLWTVDPGATVTLTGGEHEVALTLVDGYRYLHVWSEPDPDQPVFCPEPYTAPTDAFAHPDGLRWARPNSRFFASFSLTLTRR